MQRTKIVMLVATYETGQMSVRVDKETGDQLVAMQHYTESRSPGKPVDANGKPFAMCLGPELLDIKLEELESPQEEQGRYNGEDLVMLVIICRWVTVRLKIYRKVYWNVSDALSMYEGPRIKIEGLDGQQVSTYFGNPGFLALCAEEIPSDPDDDQQGDESDA